MSAVQAILTDTTRCTGCEQCVEACRAENRLGEDAPRRWKRSIDDLSSTRYTTIIRRPGNRFVRQQCRHCARPACVSACIVGALHKRPEGPVTYDPDRCMGCRYCMMACPYGIPRYDWEAAVPFVRKCTLCYHRLEAGKQPACTEACPHEATVFGDREALIAEAHRRIEAEPQKYQNAVMGETEVGGTSVLYVSDIPLDFLAFKPELGEQPLDDLTWAALSKVPPMVVGVGTLMAGIWWVSGRRRKLAAEAARTEDESRSQPEPEPEADADADDDEERS
jgi:formate dehydrogenase iron-sulfur subunit